MIFALTLSFVLANAAVLARPQTPVRENSISTRESFMANDARQVLQASHNPQELQTAALTLARSDNSSDHDLLRESLGSAGFLGRLDSPGDYQASPRKRLRISRVLEGLSTNTAPSAYRVLAYLTHDRTFLMEDERIVALIEASARLRPPPPEFIAFWDRYSQPDDGFTPVTITALVDNGTEPALQLFEKKMADPGHEDDVKIAWMHSRILPHRNDLLLLETCERLLKGGLPERLRPDLVESLCDYRPGEWFRPATAVNPPDRSLASPAARAELRKICLFARDSLPLSPTQKSAVERTLLELGNN
jgi:hypothetical protein